MSVNIFSFGLFAILIAGSSIAMAHGPIASQASTAIHRSVEAFLRDESEAVQKTFQAISSTVIGDERFKVEITLTEKRKMTYTCGLDASVKPVKWGCKKD